MPGLDRTGPEGKGSATGRKAGRCNNDQETELTDFTRGRRTGKELGFKTSLKTPVNRSKTGRKRGW